MRCIIFSPIVDFVRKRTFNQVLDRLTSQDYLRQFSSLKFNKVSLFSLIITDIMILNKLSVFLLFSFIAASFQLQRVLVQNSFPMAICTPGDTGVTNFQGIEIELFNEVYSSFGLNSGDWEYECVDSNATLYTKLAANPSDYIGGFGALRVSLNYQLQGFTFSGPTLHTGLSIVVSSEKSEWIFLKICTIGSFVTILGVGLVMAILQYYFERKEYPFEDYLWNAFSSMFFVTSVRLRSTPSRILMIVFWFCILIFTSAYAANLTAVLTIDKGNQEIDQVSDLEQTVIKTPPNYMTALPLYGIRPIQFTGDLNATALLEDLNEGNIDGYAFEDSIAQMLERQSCEFEKKVRLFHQFNYVLVFSSNIADSVIDQVNLGLEEALENNSTIARVQSFLENGLGLSLSCQRESPIEADKMSFADILHLGEILGGALGLSIILHILSKAKFYRMIQQYLVKKHFLNNIDESRKTQRKVGDELIIDNLKQVTKTSMENLSSGINERLDQMDEKVTKFYEILLNTQANSEINPYDLSRDLDENNKSGSFSDESMEKNMDEHPIRDFRSDIPLEDYTPMQSPNQSLLRHDNDGEIDGSLYRGR